MKRFALFLLSVAALGLLVSADKPKPPQNITWDATKCTLSWRGTDGVDYKIDFHQGTMSGAGKEYPLSQSEQQDGHAAFNQMLTVYLLNSEVWFEKGGVYNDQTDPGPRPLAYRSQNRTE